MSYPHQPGSSQFEGGAAYEAYMDDMEKLRAENERLRTENESLKLTLLELKNNPNLRLA